MSIHVCAYEYTRMCVYSYAYVRIKMRIYPYTHIRVCSLVFMSWLNIVFLLSMSYCSKEKLDSTKKLNNYAATTSNMKTTSHAVASVYELDTKYVLIDI